MTHPIEHPDAVERVDTAELRRLLEKADLELPLEAIEESCAACKREGKSEWAVSELVGGYHDMFGDEHQAKLIVAAVNALPALLSQLDKLETEKAEHVAGLKRFAQQLDGLHDLIIAAEASNASLVGALRKSAEGWANAIELGLLPPQHVACAEILRDTARQALSTLESGVAAADNNRPPSEPWEPQCTYCAARFSTRWEKAEHERQVHPAADNNRKGAETETAGWLPIVLCPTDGIWRMCRLPDGREMVCAFDGGLLGHRRWQSKSFGYHNPSRPSGETRGGVEQFTAAYDTCVVADLPDGVYPTHFRPNDTVHGAPVLKGGEQ